MTTFRSLTFAAALLLAAAANADTVKMSGISGMADGDRPARGMTQARVQSKYGSPRSTRAAVGDPPISRWEYQDFVVYFEHDKVIHTVYKR